MICFVMMQGKLNKLLPYCYPLLVLCIYIINLVLFFRLNLLNIILIIAYNDNDRNSYCLPYILDTSNFFSDKYS